MNKKILSIDGTELTLKELATPDRTGNPRVMTLLRKKKLNPEDVPEELLMLSNRNTTSDESCTPINYRQICLLLCAERMIQ